MIVAFRSVVLDAATVRRESSVQERVDRGSLERYQPEPKRVGRGLL
jgi:hypothetical protein